MNTKIAALSAVSALLAAGVIAGCASTPASHTIKPHTATAVPAAATSAAAPAPVASPNGNVSGSCDVSLSASITGQNYLTADVTAANTGNIGEKVRIKVGWPQQGFSPITETRTIRLPFGKTVTVHFHYAASTEQISNFQDVQLASSGNDVCSYHGTELASFGATH